MPAGINPAISPAEGGGKDKVKQFKDTRQFPADSVSLEDAQEFCRRLSDLPEEKKAGRVYRLPTEEEWEYACRAGTTTPYYFGKTISPEQANCRRTISAGPLRSAITHPNKFGLYDMHGNLLQWCARWHPIEKT